MAKEKILITAKTYPTLSEKYDELVCTAGLREDGSWIRLYPNPFRKLEDNKRYSKFDWIEVDIERNTSDFRPETYRLLSPDSIKVVDKISCDGNGSWPTRRKLVLNNIYTNKSKLLTDCKQKEACVSLATFKPSKIIDFIAEPDDLTDKHIDKLKLIEAKQLQIDLFAGNKPPFKPVEKLTYAFSYRFQDDEGVESTLKIIDWEIGALYWNCLRTHAGDEKKAIEDVRKKYWDDFAKTKEVFLFLGTTLQFHRRNAPNPFVIIGVFPPKEVIQESFL